MDDIQRPLSDPQKIDSQIGPRGQSELEGVGADGKPDHASGVKLQVTTTNSKETEPVRLNAENVSSDNDGPVRQVSPKRTTRRKPDFEGFVENVRNAIASGESRDSVTSLLATVTFGYKDKFTSDHLSRVFSLVKDWSRCSQFALKLSVHIKQKPNSPKIACFLKNRLVSHSREIAAYVGTVETGSDPEQRRAQLLTWIDRSMREAIQQTTEAALNAQQWVCWALVCLMEEPWIIRTEAIYAILERFGNQGDKCKTEDEEDLELVVELGSIFGTRQVNIQKIAVGTKLFAAARSSERYSREELRIARLGISAKLARIDELSRIVDELKQALANANDRIATLNHSVTQKAGELEQEKEERRRDQDHWELLSEQRSVKQAIEISSRLAHEISEARLCLNDDVPNVRMASDRLNRMDKWLEKLKGN